MRGITVLLLGLFCILCVTGKVKAIENDEEPWEEYDLQEAQKVLEQKTSISDFDLGKYVKGVVTGKQEFSAKDIWNRVSSEIGKQWEGCRQRLIRLLILGVLSGIFAAFGASMGRKELGETGFFIVYMLLFTTLASAFVEMFQITKEMLEGLMDFVKVFFPAFSLSVAAVKGSATGYGVYELAMLAIYLVENIMIRMVLPGVQIYFFLALSNQMMREQRFTKITELIRTFLHWVMKTLFGLLLGVQGIQLLILPVSDQVHKNVLLRGISSLPGVGGTVGTVAETVLGTGTIVKSAIGVGGIIAICIISLVPLCQVGVYTVTNQVGAALVQPVTDKRIVSSISVAAESGKLLVRLLTMGALIFLCSMGLVVAMTK